MEDTQKDSEPTVHHYKFNGGDAACFDTHDGKFCGKRMYPNEPSREYYAEHDGETFTITGVKK